MQCECPAKSLVLCQTYEASIRGLNKWTFIKVYSRVIRTEPSLGSSDTSWCGQPSYFWHSQLKPQPQKYEQKSWGYPLCKSNWTEVKFLKLISSGILSFYKHIFESISFLIASITALSVHKWLVKISVCQTSGTNRQVQLTAWRCSGLSTGQPADPHRILAAKLCPLNKLHTKGDSFHSCTPQIFIDSP